jgi:hypothetical protein
MALRSSTDRQASHLGRTFLLVRCRRGQRIPVAFALRGLIQPDGLEHIRGPFDLVARLSTNDSDAGLDWLNDLPGIESFVRLEATS